MTKTFRSTNYYLFKNIIVAKNQVPLSLRKRDATILEMRSCPINAAEQNVIFSSQINVVKGIKNVENN